MRKKSLLPQGRILRMASASASLAFAVALIPSAAQAATWKTGAEVSFGFHSSWPGAGTVGNDKPCGDGGSWVAYAEVKTDGDYTYVSDTCRDGKSAVAKVIVYNNDRTIRSQKVCRNPHGNRTTARCNWDWVESDSNTYCLPEPPEYDGTRCGNKALIAGTLDADTGKVYWDHGTSIMFKD